MNDGRETVGETTGAAAAGGPPPARAPRVVVADDSAFMRRLIADSLARAGVKVVAEAANGRAAVDACREHEPDVLCLDLAMPELDGIAVLGELAGREPRLPVVVISSFDDEEGARAVDALAAGAFDLVPKLAGRGKLGAFTDQVARTVFAAAQATAVQATAAQPTAAQPTTDPTTTASQPPQGTPTPPTSAPPPAPAPAATRRLVIIASSTGGPQALTAVVPQLPEHTGRGVIVVQHMPAGFTRSLAARLDGASKMKVTEPQGGEPIEPDGVFIAPGGQRTHIRRGRIKLGDEPPVGGLRPCADVTIADAVEEYVGDVVLVVLTGMGHDALEGARQVHEAGGVVLAQDPATCTVYGMPRAIAEAGLAHEIVPIEQMAAAIARHADA